MMQLSNPKQVVNLDDFLPPDGEERFDMFFADGVLSLDIFYETEDSGNDAKRRILFDHAKYFFKTPFPGYSFFSCPDDRNLSLLNSLVEYEHSDMLAMERGSSMGAGYKHYRLFLHSTGVAIHVIAQSCEISVEELLT
ncbi:hypothetical protein ACFQNF_20045 [Iodobacter arcticus]|uniref:Uncharacterized protein n=1 Tax=Iodobacter arcticus TaxID=590593 RepID=A0ABW2R2X9_9NEIS